MKSLRFQPGYIPGIVRLLLVALISASALGPASLSAVSRSGGGAISFTVQAPPPPFVAIHTIQGTGAGSTYAGQAVLTEGIVTAVVRFNNGFFLQTPDLEVDPDPNTSEGIVLSLDDVISWGNIQSTRVRR